MKYHDAMVVFEEIPDEITLAINITNCPCKCSGCHSKFLWDDIGTELTNDELDMMIDRERGITCVCFMGGDREPKYVEELSKHIKDKYGNIKTAWYSGMDDISSEVNIYSFDYIKIGHYDEERGPLNKETTNQKLFKIDGGVVENITNRFWNR